MSERIALTPRLSQPHQGGSRATPLGRGVAQHEDNAGAQSGQMIQYSVAQYWPCRSRIVSAPMDDQQRAQSSIQRLLQHGIQRSAGFCDGHAVRIQRDLGAVTPALQFLQRLERRARRAGVKLIVVLGQDQGLSVPIEIDRVRCAPVRALCFRLRAIDWRYGAVRLS